MKIQPDLSQLLQNTNRAAQQERSQATEDAAKTQGVAQTAVVPPQDIVQTSQKVTNIEGPPIDVGAPPPAPAAPPDNAATASGVFAENAHAAIASAGDSPFSNPTAENLARAFLAQQVFSDREEIEAEKDLLLATSQLIQLAIANAKKEIARLQKELKKAEKSNDGGFFGSIMKVLDPIGSMLLEMMNDKDGKTKEIQAKLDNAHKRLDSLIDHLVALTKHACQLMEAQLQEGAEQIAEETVEVGPDGVPKGLKNKMKAALNEGLIALMGQQGVTLDQAVSQLTDRAAGVLEEYGIQVTDDLRARLASSIRENLFGEQPALETVKAGIDVVATYSQTATQQAATQPTVIR